MMLIFIVNLLNKVQMMLIFIVNLLNLEVVKDYLQHHLKKFLQENVKSGIKYLKKNITNY
jgi:uncharacterized membrane protein required for colicin V production